MGQFLNTISAGFLHSKSQLLSVIRASTFCHKGKLPYTIVASFIYSKFLPLPMKSIHCIVLFVMTIHCIQPATAQHRREHCIMFYNAENLFHPSDDSITADDDFTPEGVRRWNFYRYNRKIAAICKVILAVNGWEPPDAVCLSEIENREVLDDIRFHPLMLGQHYRVLHRDSPDRRGIDVAILYRADRLECLDTTWIEIRDADGTLMPTREILSATFRLASTGDKVVICANHWTSKYGGALETEGKRMLQSRLLGDHIQKLTGQRVHDPPAGMVSESSLDRKLEPPKDGVPAPLAPGLSAAPGPGIIAGGDLNDLSGSVPVQMLTDTFHLEEVFPAVTSIAMNEPAPGSGRTHRQLFRNKSSAPFASAQPASVQPADSDYTLTAPASYKYQGNWGSIDHVFVGGLLQAKDCRARVFSHPLLLEEDTKYTGKKPFRTYTGFRYNGGFSDHLPLLIHFVMPGKRNDVAGASLEVGAKKVSQKETGGKKESKEELSRKKVSQKKVSRKEFSR